MSIPLITKIMTRPTWTLDIKGGGVNDPNVQNI